MGSLAIYQRFLWIVLWGESPQNVKELVESITLFRGQSNLVELDS